MKSNINKLILIESHRRNPFCIHSKQNPTYDSSTTDHVLTI